jgi:hypothetical protein
VVFHVSKLNLAGDPGLLLWDGNATRALHPVGSMQIFSVHVMPISPLQFNLTSLQYELNDTSITSVFIPPNTTARINFAILLQGETIAQYTASLDPGNPSPLVMLNVFDAQANVARFRAYMGTFVLYSLENQTNEVWYAIPYDATNSSLSVSVTPSIRKGIIYYNTSNALLYYQG